MSGAYDRGKPVGQNNPHQQQAAPQQTRTIGTRTVQFRPPRRPDEVTHITGLGLNGQACTHIIQHGRGGDLSAIKKITLLAVGAAAMMTLAACSTTGAGSSATAYAPDGTAVDQARHNYVACLLETRADASCMAQRTRFADAVRAGAFKHPKTFSSHRQAASNQAFINLTVEKAVSDTRRLALR